MKTISRTINALSIVSSALLLALLWRSSALADTVLVDDASQTNETARILLVDDDGQECPKAGFTTIQTAVNAATPGDTIQVCPGTYNEQVEIAKRLTLVGVERNGKKASVVQPSNMTANSDFLGDPVAAGILVRDASHVTIRNITVDGINNGIVCDPAPPVIDGIFYRNASGSIESVVIKNMLTPGGCAFGDGLDVQGDPGTASHLTVRDSTVHDYDSVGILALGAGAKLQVLNNVVTGPTPTVGRDPVGIFLALDARGSIEGNTVINNIDATCISSEECDFVGIGIIVFRTHNVSVLRNVVGKSQRAISTSFTSGVRILENTVFDTDVADAINLFESDHTVVKGNTITNTDNAAVIVFTGNNTIRDNTINEAAIGLLVAAGNNLSHNMFFNTSVIQEPFDPGASAESSRAAKQNGIAPSVLRRLPR